MNRQTKRELEDVYTGILTEGATDKKMVVGNSGTNKPQDLEGPTTGTQKGTGAENTDADKASDAEASLQGDPKDVDDSKTGGTPVKESKGSKFEDLYKKVVAENLDDSSIESGGFDDEMGDFPPSGEEEADAQSLEDDLEPETLGSLFKQFAEIAGKIADSYDDEEGIPDDGELIDGEMGLEGDVAVEAVQSTPAPDSTAKLQSKGNMNTKAVKVVKQAVSSASSGQENGGKPTNAKETTLGPKKSMKVDGSGPAVDGKDASAFE